MSPDLSHSLLLVPLDSLVLFTVCKYRHHPAPGWWGVTGILVAGGVAAYLLIPDDIFGFFRLLAWTVFIHLPVVLLAGGVLQLSSHRFSAGAQFVIALSIMAVGVDAFFIEPRRLEINTYTVRSAKITRPFRIAVVADLQTDTIGPYEAQALRAVLAQQPDIILLLGDYIQHEDPDGYQQAVTRLNTLLHRLDFQAPGGAYALEGNVDWENWPDIFAGLSIMPLSATRRFVHEEIILTGLSYDDTFNPHLTIPAQDKFHIVFGHAPDFALGRIHADLLLAGHTHGGQVQLPGLGPLLTLSRVPRAWAHGMTKPTPTQTLIVSRGIGLERGAAPRLRFLCKPEVVMVELVPVTAHSGM